VNNTDHPLHEGHEVCEQDTPRTEAEDAFAAAVNAPSATGRGIAVPHYRDAERIWQAIAPFLVIEAEAAAGPQPPSCTMREFTITDEDDPSVQHEGVYE